MIIFRQLFFTYTAFSTFFNKLLLRTITILLCPNVCPPDVWNNIFNGWYHKLLFVKLTLRTSNRVCEMGWSEGQGVTEGDRVVYKCKGVTETHRELKCSRYISNVVSQLYGPGSVPRQWKIDRHSPILVLKITMETYRET